MQRNGSDGHFDLYYHEGWAHLTVYPPIASGQPVYREDVQNRMRLLTVPRASGSEIVGMIESADGEPHQLVEWPQGHHLESVITVTVGDDRMSAGVHITAPQRGARTPTVDNVFAALQAAGVRHGIDRKIIGLLLGKRNYGEQVVVAHGEPAIDARPGEIHYHFNPDRGQPYLMMEYRRINLKELNFIENRSAGSLLAELVPPMEASDGQAVTGERVPASRIVEPVELVAGPNAELTDGGAAIYATEDGNARIVGGAVTIEPLVSVENVNYETGNIKFDGSVVVHKSIADGFVIEAGGDVQVGRGVGRATIIAGGNVLLKSGINGGGEGSIRCAGNLVARYIEGSSVHCGSDVFVEEAIMHSDLSADRHCVLSGRRAEIIASDLIVGGSLWCKKLGNLSEAATSVSIGIPPHVLTSYRQARHDLERSEEELGSCEEKLRQVTRSLADGRNDPLLVKARDQLQREVANIGTAIGTARRSARKFRDRLEASKNSMLVVEDTIFTGSLISFGRAEYRPPIHGARSTILKHLRGEIIESGYSSHDRPKINFDEDQ